jgi:hypothetical protein
MRIKSAAFISVSLLALLGLAVVGLLVYHTGKNEPLKTEISERVENTEKEDVALSDETTLPVEVVPGNIGIPDYKHLKLSSPEVLQEYVERDQSMRAAQALSQALQALHAKVDKFSSDENMPDVKYMSSLSPQALSEYLNSEISLEPLLERSQELMQEAQAVKAMVDKYIEGLRAQGIFVPEPKPTPFSEELDRLFANSNARSAEIMREIEEQKKIVFEMNESMDRFSKETREGSARVNAWLERIDNAKSTKTAPSDTNAPPSDTKLTPTNTGTWQNDLDTYMTTLDADIVNKYPLATFVQSLSKEEFDTHFNTDSKTFLQSQQKQMVTDIRQRVNQYLSNNGDNRTDKIGFIREKLSQYWDADVIDSIMKDIK